MLIKKSFNAYWIYNVLEWNRWWFMANWNLHTTIAHDVTMNLYNRVSSLNSSLFSMIFNLKLKSVFIFWYYYLFIFKNEGCVKVDWFKLFWYLENLRNVYIIYVYVFLHKCDIKILEEGLYFRGIKEYVGQ